MQVSGSIFVQFVHFFGLLVGFVVKLLPGSWVSIVGECGSRSECVHLAMQASPCPKHDLHPFE